MPELPEVEVVKKSLKKFINNLTIKNIKINEINLRYKINVKHLKQIIGLKKKNKKKSNTSFSLKRGNDLSFRHDRKYIY